MVRSYPDMSVRVIQYAPYRITFCLYFGMEIDLVPFRFYVFRNIIIFVSSSSKLQASFHYKRDGDDDDDGVRGIG